MQYDVLVNIHTSQFSMEGGHDSMDLISPATLKDLEDGTLLLTYEESEITGMEGTITHIFLEDRHVTMLREGNISTQLDFQEGQEHVSMYETPFGSMLLRIRTVRLKNTVSMEKGGIVDLYYTMEIDNQLIGHYLLHLVVQRPAGAGSAPGGAEDSAEADSLLF